MCNLFQIRRFVRLKSADFFFTYFSVKTYVVILIRSASPKRFQWVYAVLCFQEEIRKIKYGYLYLELCVGKSKAHIRCAGWSGHSPQLTEILDIAQYAIVKQTLYGKVCRFCPFCSTNMSQYARLSCLNIQPFRTPYFQTDLHMFAMTRIRQNIGKHVSGREK